MDLNELYDLLPALDCKKLCQSSCKGVFEDGEDPCRHLLAGECNIYEERPMVCRLWGIDKSMWCEHGCVPRGGWLPEWSAIMLLEAERKLKRSS